MSTTEKSLRFLVILGNYFGLFPVSDNPSQEKGFYFSCKCLRMAYSLIVMVAAFCTLILQLIYLSQTLNYFRVATCFFFVNWAVCVAIFLRLAIRWPQVIRKWSAIDAVMDRKYGKPKDLNIRLWSITAILMTLAAVDHVLGAFYLIMHCRYAYGDIDAGTYYHKCVPNYYPSENHVSLAILIHLEIIFAAFTWTYNDLFIIAVSIALAIRFQQIRLRLQENQDKVLPLYFWRDIREDYVHLSNLCRFLDDCVAFNLSISFMSNLISILLQLFQGFNDIDGWLRKVYFGFSFGFLLFRTVAVVLYAAWINEESREPAFILHSVPATTYNNEIQQLLMQISFDNVALTGNRMYRVTKGLILNVAVAIVTYELVLIQFSQSNMTKGNN